MEARRLRALVQLLSDRSASGLMTDLRIERHADYNMVKMYVVVNGSDYADYEIWKMHHDIPDELVKREGDGQWRYRNSRKEMREKRHNIHFQALGRNDIMERCEIVTGALVSYVDNFSVSTERLLDAYLEIWNSFDDDRDHDDDVKN